MNIKALSIILLVLGIILTGVGTGVWFANGDRIETQVTPEEIRYYTEDVATTSPPPSVVTYTIPPSTKLVELPANTSVQGFGIGMGVVGIGMTLTGLVLLIRKD